jgi:hypothetical protein
MVLQYLSSYGVQNLQCAHMLKETTIGALTIDGSIRFHSNPYALDLVSNRANKPSITSTFMLFFSK